MRVSASSKTSLSQTGRRVRRFTLGVAAVLALCAAGLAQLAIQKEQPVISDSTWGLITAPVYGSSETCCGGAYAQAEFFAGPNKLGSYYAGVLPNGKKVTPAGTSIQIGMNPLGIAVTPDGKYIITSNDDERDGNFTSYQSSVNLGGYSLSVISSVNMQVVSQYNVSGKFFIGLQVSGTGPYTVWASGGPDNDVKIFSLSTTGTLTPGNPSHIVIPPVTPNNRGYVSNYTPGPQWNTKDGSGNLPPAPTNFSRTSPVQTTFPAGSALSPGGRFLYVACNGDNSVAAIDTTTLTIANQKQVGYFPYSVSVNPVNSMVAVSNWGITAYKFFNPTYDANNNLTALGAAGANTPAGFFKPVTSTGPNAGTSSVSLLDIPGGNGYNMAFRKSNYLGRPLDIYYHVGDTHPSATVVVRKNSTDYLYVTKTNSDRIGIVNLSTGATLGDEGEDD